jgi:hypothetical protein
MKTVETNSARIDPRVLDGRTEVQHERWAHCHVNWTAVWIGALATFSMLILLALVGIALGAHEFAPQQRLVDVHKLGLWTIVFSICGAFFSSVVGGWAAAKIAGILHAEPAILHGTFVWLVTVPILVVSAALGASSLLGGWYSALAPNSTATATGPFTHPEPLGLSPTAEEISIFRTQTAEYNRNVKQWQEETPKVIRNTALLGVTSLLLGLVGCVIGGWMASGEPMNFTHYRTRKPRYHMS